MKEIEWVQESPIEARAEVPDPIEPSRFNRFILSVISNRDGRMAPWSVWGNRRGVNVSDSISVAKGTNARIYAMDRATRVLRAILGVDES